MLYAAGGFGVLFLLFWIRRATLAGKLSSYDQVAQTLSTKLEELPDVALDDLSEEETSDTSEEAATSSESAETTEEVQPAAVDRAAKSRLSQRIRDWQISLTEVRDGVAAEESTLRQRLQQDRLRMGQLEQAISQEQERLDRAQRLQEMQDEIREKVTERERHIEVCAMADELIRGATREISYQFNRKLRGLVSKTLPLFTENRYEHLQIDEDLTVRAFSSEKRDFMDLDEISSGTQRQIMLAVRLALSQELVERTVKGSQFLFLDEPFAFFDEHRTRSALTVLPTLSEELNQIWIIGQAFSDDLKFDWHIVCDREKDAIANAET